MSKRQGPPKHQNGFAWKPNAGRKINETEVGGKLRPLSEITGVCPRCKEQIDWKRRYGKYKFLSEPAKCLRCSKRAVRQAYHSLCTACAKEQNVCAKCCRRVGSIVGRDGVEVEAEQKMLEDAIKNARERDRRSLIRAMNKGTSKSSEKAVTTEGNKVGDLFPSASLEEYAAKSRGHNIERNDHVGDDDDEGEEEEEEDGDGNEYIIDDDGDENSDSEDGDKSEDENEHEGDVEAGDKSEDKCKHKGED